MWTDAATVVRTVKEEKGPVERRSDKRKSQRRESKKKEDQRARKGRTVAKHCVFQCLVAQSMDGWMDRKIER